MNNSPFSLFHHSAPPKSGLAGRAPLLLLLHGFGANEDDLFSLAPYLDERFLIVSARAPYTLGFASHAWYHLGFTPEGFIIDPREVESSRQTLRKFVAELTRHYPVDPHAVYLLGFSQGAMMSLDLALREPELVAGVAALSGRLMPSTLAQMAAPDALTGLPIFVAHGARDTVVPIGYGRAARDELAQLPVSLTYREYPMGHEISADSLRDATNWLSEQLGQQILH
jgi:phospholipase/carboxylesterase